MAHKVKCKYCGLTFDRDVEECVKINTRYAHSECYAKGQQAAALEEEKYRKITDLIVTLDKGEIDWARVGSQIKRFLNNGMTYDGIYYTLYYFHIIKKNKYKSVGIVPYVYDEAKRYYEREDNIYGQAMEVKTKGIKTETKEDIVVIEPLKKDKKLISFDYD